MKRYIHIATILLSLISASFAEYDANRPAAGEQILSAQDLWASQIKSKNGEILGIVKDFIADKNRSNVKYVLMSYDDRVLPVPWSAFEINKNTSNEANETNKNKLSWDWNQKKSCLILNINKEQLRRAPWTNSSDVNQFGSISQQQRIENFYSQYTPGNIRAAQNRTLRSNRADIFKISEILGMNVDNMQDKSIGSIRDIVIDSTRGDIAFGLVGFGDVLGTREQIAAVPWSAININIARKIARLDATRDKLEAVALQDGDISKLSQRQFASRVYEEFGAEPYWRVYGYEPAESENQQSPADKNTNKNRDDNEPNLKQNIK